MRCAILDDYQNVALSMADWGSLAGEAEITVFNAPIGEAAEIVAALADYEIVCLMRERTPFTAEIIEALPKLRLIVTSGPRNAAIDVAAANARGVTVCGTASAAHPTAELVFAHMLEFARKVGHENARLKAGAVWQETIGLDLSGKTLGVLGLGRLGARVARIAVAFEMNVIAWSDNLAAERCAELGVDHVSKTDLFRASDFLSIHLQLSQRTRGLVGADTLALMRPGAILVNTSRGPIVEEGALLDAVRAGRIAGACLDVFDEEPLPLEHPYRTEPKIQISPHLGYVTEANFRLFYSQMVEDIRAFAEGNPMRVVA